MSTKLGKWAVIDIETSGINPLSDSIIDVGYLQFEGTKLIKKYQSLVNFPMSRDRNVELSQFIQKLTGIAPEHLKNAPTWQEVLPEVQELAGHHLVAHNSDFEKSFLENHFDVLIADGEKETYEDSLFYLASLFPGRSTLNLESFLIDLGLAEKEIHRGFEDSLDLLKVLLLSTYLTKKDRNFALNYDMLLNQHDLSDYWFAEFFKLNEIELFEVSSQIGFDLVEAYDNYIEMLKAKNKIQDVDLGDISLGFDGETVKNIFREDKRIQEILPKYQYRESQEVLAIKTGQSFKNSVHAMVQAPTGTGKTLGYLVPSALFSLSEKQQVLISTGTKTLQQQAMEKDVPVMRKILGLNEQSLKVERLVGSNNHLCELLYRNKDTDGELFENSNHFEDKFTAFYFDLIFYFNGDSEKKDILRADIPYVLKRKLDNLRKIDLESAVDYRSCTGNQCPFKGKCSYINGLRRAKDANIIVGNHALMFTWPKAFPRPSYIITDEAHKIEDETTKSHTLEATQEMFESLNKSLMNLQGVGSLFYLLSQTEQSPGESTEVINQIRTETISTQRMLADHLIPLPDVFERHFKKLPRYTDEYWNETPMVEEGRSITNTGQSILNHLLSLKTILEDYYEKLLPYISIWDVKNLEDESLITAVTRFITFAEQVGDISILLDKLLNKDEEREFSRSLKFHEDFGYSMSVAPINVGKVLHDGLLQTSNSVVFTSATLSNANGDQGSKGIEWSTGYIYLENERRFKSGFYLPAVYDYKNKTKVFICDDTPPFYDSSFVKFTLGPIMNLIRDLKGRSLLLFSSRKRFEAACEVLLSGLAGEIEVFIQGLGNSVVEDFKRSSNGILIGMESFGEGIDIPGESLQFVFIDKIPDIRMDLVIQKRREFFDRNIGNEFTDYYLSHRTRSLHQKLGRLLRTESDVGGVIIVDSRIKRWKGQTMDKVMKLMEPYKINRAGLDHACDEIRDFLQ